MSTTIDQKAYLQKYLGGPSKDKKKKKKKAIKGTGFKIIDDDIDLSKLRPLEGDEIDILDEGEDAPQVAGIIDERPEELRKIEQFQTSSKWRVINQDDGFNSKLKVQEIKKDIKETKKENEIIFGKMYSDSEDEQQKNDSDLSPPRKNSKRSSPPKKPEVETSKKKYDSDASPPRKNEQIKERVRKPSRWGDADKKSPSPQRRRKSSSSDPSPPRKNKNYDSDESPPRNSKHTSKHSHNSKYQSDSDASPPRRERDRKRDISDKRSNLKQSKARHNSDSDLSPPRKSHRHTSNGSQRHERKSRKSQSPKKKHYDSDLSPPRKNTKDKRNSSPNRKKNSSDSDLSPPRKSIKHIREDKRYNRNSDSPPPTNKKMAKTLEGKKAGLQDARQLREENEEFRRKEDEVFKRLGDEVSGRNAQAVSRKSKRESSQDRQKQKEKAERQKEIDAKYKMWGKGLKQIEAQQAQYHDYLHESAKPLARHKDDKDLERNLKEVERAGDPMLQYIKEKRRERGELPPEKPSYKGNFPPNRFNIRPGYRWDGVDRSNGYEGKLFEQRNKKKAQEEEAYKWSTEDL